jgi:long-chain acyl-CoA synthetase
MAARTPGSIRAMTSLAELADRHDEEHGDYPRLWFEEREYSSFELSDAARRVAGGLRRLGLGVGDRVLVMLPNGIEVGSVYQGTWRAGGAVTPVLFLLSAPDVARIARESEPTVAVTSPEFLPVVQQAIEGVDSVRAVVVTGDAAPEGTVAWSDLLDAEPLADPVPRSDDDLAAVLFTGGTTGASKGVMLSHGNISFDARAGVEAAEVGEDEVGLSALPLAHSFGILVAAAGLYVKGYGVLLRWFDPFAFLDAIERFRVTRTTVVPTMLQFLLQAPLEERDLSSLRYVTSGAAALPVEVLTEWERRTGSRVTEGYGLTEATAGVCTNRPSMPWKPGSVGVPFPGVEVTARDDDGVERPAGEVGELCVRGPSVMLGYWRQPEATADVMVDGWLRTGDVGRVDEDGYVFVVERKKDVIIRGGLNLYPRDLEEVLQEHPAVAMAGVVGRPDPTYGEEAVAFVTLRPGGSATEDDIVAFLADRLTKPKRPREVRVVPALPLTPVGKVARRELRAMLEDQA